MNDQYVVVTRYLAPSGRPIVHCYGPWPTRRRAEGVRDAMLRDVGEVVIEAAVCKVLDVEMAEA